MAWCSQCPSCRVDQLGSLYSGRCRQAGRPGSERLEGKAIEDALLGPGQAWNEIISRVLGPRQGLRVRSALGSLLMAAVDAWGGVEGVIILSMADS